MNESLFASEFYQNLCNKHECGLRNLFRDNSMFAFVGDFGDEWIAFGKDDIVEHLLTLYSLKCSDETEGCVDNYSVVITKQENYLSLVSDFFEKFIFILGILKTKQSQRKFVQHFVLNRDNADKIFCKTSIIAYLSPSDASQDLVRCSSYSSLEDCSSLKLSRCSSSKQFSKTDSDIWIDNEESEKNSHAIQKAASTSFADALRNGLSQEQKEKNEVMISCHNKLSESEKKSIATSDRKQTKQRPSVEKIHETTNRNATENKKSHGEVKRAEATLYVANIPKYITQHHLINWFQEFGTVHNARIIERSGCIFGFVNFEHKESVEKVLQYADSSHHIYVNQIVLRVDRYRKTIKLRTPSRQKESKVNAT
ncbi:hypothetical protein B4U79_16906 [Dinothrombium tinctorium]|uniref:RRM domain-containing protein n=1 Tax=Dinothrombium tinctorium TaxID=1965070 RepID=A0A3S3SKC8_9ACAR|nr:hypothetical protein B4U79_16906 [Dinothrombium tinctorium]